MKKYNTTLTARITAPHLTPGQAEFIKRIATRDSVSESQVVRDALDYLKEHPGADQDYRKTEAYSVVYFPIAATVEQKEFAKTRGNGETDTIRRALWAYQKDVEK